MTGAPALEAAGISAGYDDNMVLRDLQLTVAAGEMTALIGPNGSGKSTLLRTLAGLLSPQHGTVRCQGEPLEGMPGSRRARTMAFVPQQVHFAFPFTVREAVMMGRTPYQGWMGWAGHEDERVVEQCLRVMRVEQLSDRSVEALSGGELQRVVLAQALAQRTALLLLDEPTAHLDLGFCAEIMNLLAALNREHGVTVLVSLHDLNLAALYCRRIILLAEGRIQADGPGDEILREEVLSRVYGPHVEVTKHAIDGRPQIGLRTSKITVGVGENPIE
jgi:iron complex transport system ATP-binding protein